MKQVNKLLNLGGIRLDAIVLAVVMILGNLAPFAHYRYNKNDYTVSGFDLIGGKTIAGGSVELKPNGTLIAALVLICVIIVAAVLAKSLKVRLSSGIITLAALASAVLYIRFTTSVEAAMGAAKRVGASPGTVIPIAAAVVILVINLYVLYREKVLHPLDFMVLPGMIYLIINNYIPMFGIYIAFKKVDYTVGLWKSPWVGLENFRYLFSTQDAWIITRNTILYNIVFIILGIVTGMVIGICLAELFSKLWQKIYQTTILLPQLISMVIVAYIVYALFSNETGLVNHWLGEGNEINFYATKGIWPFILVFVNNWKQLGYNAIIFLSSIIGINRSLYEAARVDGATKMQTITKITIPQLRPTIITLFIMQTGRIFYSDFGLFYQVPLDAGALYSVTNTVDTYVYRALLVSNNISTSSAASTYQAICGFIVVMAVNLIIRKFDRESAMF